jgi:hypothetical protein
MKNVRAAQDNLNASKTNSKGKGKWRSLFLQRIFKKIRSAKLE